MYRIMYCGWFPLFSWIYCGHCFESEFFFSFMNDHFIAVHIFSVYLSLLFSFSLVTLIITTPNIAASRTRIQKKKIHSFSSIALQLFFYCAIALVLFGKRVSYIVWHCVLQTFFVVVVLLAIVYGIWGAKQKNESNRRKSYTKKRKIDWLSFVRYSFGIVL